MFMTTPIAVFLGFIISSLIIASAAKILGQSVIATLTAIGTVGAVILALWSQEIKNIINKPKLEIEIEKKEDPKLMKLIQLSSTGELYKGYFIVCSIKNSGKEIAKDSQIQLTSIMKKKDGDWKIAKPWIPLQMTWVISKGIFHTKNEVSRDLIRNAPNLFTIGAFSNNIYHGSLILNYYSSNKIQPESLPPGEYCFEITTYSPSLKEPLKRYIYISFDDFKPQDEFEDNIKTKVKVKNVEKKPPLYKGEFIFY